MPSIRPYERSDFERVREICLKTTEMRVRTHVQRQVMLNTYCHYYVECEPHNCFVAVDDEDNAIGYILCAENYARFETKFCEKYVPILKKFGKLRGIAAMGSVVMQKKYAGYYPAHMHIDILPEYQRQGLGTQLTDALIEHLKAKKIRGVMLVVSSKNEKGMNFYKKYGFENITTVSNVVAMGMELM